MAVPVTVSLPSDQSRHFEPSFEIFRSVDETLSSYREESDIGRLNRNKEGPIGRQTLMALRKALAMAKRTQGNFDPTIGALTLKTYGFGGDHAKVPQRREVERARKSVDYTRIELRETSDSAFARIPDNALLDLGGIGKGIAVDLAAVYLKKNGVIDAVLAASGDIRCLHRCALSIQHPFRPGSEILRFRTKGELGLSTSGTYERKIDKETHHLLAPESGMPSKTFVSVTLLGASDNAELDALATAVSVTDGVRAQKLLNGFPDVEYALVTVEKEIILSQRFMDLIAEPEWSEDIADFRITTVTASKKN